MTKPLPKINPTRIDESIGFLRTHLNEADIAPLIAALGELAKTTDVESGLEQLAEAFDNLSIPQGAVLTYAPYIGILLADDPYGGDFD